MLLQALVLRNTGYNGKIERACGDLTGEFIRKLTPQIDHHLGKSETWIEMRIGSV
jgi:hypothetical protein